MFIELRQRLRELAGSRPRYGYRRLTVMLRREGWKPPRQDWLDKTDDYLREK